MKQELKYLIKSLLLFIFLSICISSITSILKQKPKFWYDGYSIGMSIFNYQGYQSWFIRFYNDKGSVAFPNFHHSDFRDKN